ncbi:secreted protein [Nocardioides albertanoniae]|uniref:Secreted protein n=1 Tax=Nocardioides albertanoniae TaxID=1175486 RepID=A0A543A4S9_9ACTN|nr:hypothetical protein [Nocardioides albertanoniae]TQL67537.1 secreted protein [Nocardioides albertanoniae]
MPDHPPHTASRRGLLVGLGAAMAAPAVVASTGSVAHAAAGEAAGRPQQRPQQTEPECLSDLVAMGVVTHGADFVAG